MTQVLYKCLKRIRTESEELKKKESMLLEERKTIVDTHDGVKHILNRQELAKQTQLAQKQINKLEVLIRKEQKTQQQCFAVIECINDVLNNLATAECRHTNISVLENSTYSIFAGVRSRKKLVFNFDTCVILVFSDVDCEEYSFNDFNDLTQTLLTCVSNSDEKFDLEEVFDTCNALLHAVPANSEVFCICREGVELQVLIPIHNLFIVPTECCVSYIQGRIEITSN